AVSRCPAGRHRLFPQLSHPVEQLRGLADCRRTGLRRLRPALCAGRAVSRPPGFASARLLSAPAGRLAARLHQRPAARPRRLGGNAAGPGAVADRHPAGTDRELDRTLRLRPGAAGRTRGRRRCAMNALKLLPLFGLGLLITACGDSSVDSERLVGQDPQLPKPQRGLLPSMTIADPAPWDDRLPVVPEGFEIRAIASDLLIPRQTLVLPNGDILVAEGRGGNAPKLKPKDVIAGYIKAKGTTSV